MSSRYSRDNDSEDDTASIKSFVESGIKLMNKLYDMIDDEQKHNAKNISPSDSRNNSPLKNFNQINYNYMPFQQNFLSPIQGINPLGSPIIQPLNVIPQPIISTMPIAIPFISQPPINNEIPFSYNIQQITQPILVQSTIPEFSPENIIIPVINPQSNPEPINVQTPFTQISYIPELIPITSIDISQSINYSQTSYVPEPAPIVSNDIR